MTQVLVHEEGAWVQPVEPGEHEPAPAGWYTDTLSGVWLRYWSGLEWTDYPVPTALPPDDGHDDRAPGIDGRGVDPARAGADAIVAGELATAVRRLTISDTTKVAVLMVAAVVAGIVVAALGILFTT